MELDRCEKLAQYGALVNDEGALLFILDGYFPGEPTDSVVYYNGGQDALLKRTEGQLLMLDCLNEHVIGSMKKVAYVLIRENDSDRMYKATMSSEDVSHLIKKMNDERDYLSFTTHPYPLTTGAFEFGNKTCEWCNRETTVFYQEVSSDGSLVTVCPQCVWKVPRYKTKHPEAYFWPCHCNGMETIYYGKLRYEDISKKMWMEYLKNWNYEGNPHSRGYASTLKEGIRGGSVEAHLFKCDKCNAHLLYCIEDT